MKSRTIGSGGTDANIAAWEAQIDDSDSETGTCIQAAALATTAVTFNATLTGGHTALLTADSSSMVNAPTTAAITSKARIALTTNAISLTISGAGFTVEKIGFSSTSASPATVVSIQIDTTIRRCGFTINAGVLAMGTAITYTVTISNCFFISQASHTTAHIQTTTANVTCNVYHCSGLMPNGTNNVLGNENNGTLNFYNCVAQGTVCFRNTPHGDENVSQDTTAPGTTTYTSKTGVFKTTTLGSEDLSLATIWWSVIKVTDRSGTLGDLATDIVATNRVSLTNSAIDPGVWQHPATAGVINFTIGSSGADYTSLANAITGSPVSPFDNVTWTCITVSDIGAGTLNVANANSKTLTLTVQAAQRFYNGASWPSMSGAIRQGAYTTGAIVISVGGWVIEWLGIDVGASANAPSSSTGSVRISHCLINVAFPRNDIEVTGGTLTLSDTVHNQQDAAAGITCTLGTLNCYHISVNQSSGAGGMVRVAGTASAYGCVVQHNGAIAAWTGTWGGDYNVSSDTSAPGANSWQSQSSFFVTATSGGTSFDLHLASGKGGVYPTPYDSDDLAALATDIDNGTRPTSNSDAGCDHVPVVTYSATCASASGGAASSETCTFAPGTHTATAASASGGAKSSATTSHVTPTYTASCASRSGGAASAAVCTFAPLCTATVASASGGAASAASCAVTPPVFTGSCGSAAGGAKSAATCIFAVGLFLATCAARPGGTASAATCTFSPGTHTATASAAPGGVGTVATATFAPPSFSAAAASATGGPATALVATSLPPGIVVITFIGQSVVIERDGLRVRERESSTVRERVSFDS